ncbi:hypothetical protein PsorP6_019479 [Peronosclerospora sorghi]|nr:hypothetical protein PsorP6_019479 [Peronosclerospora sorghi]
MCHRAQEAIKRALLKEQDYPGIRNPHYLSEVQRHGMTSAWRLGLCRWMFKMAKTFEMEMDTVFRALHFLDQYLSVHSVDRVSLQLLVTFCMGTASKIDFVHELPFGDDNDRRANCVAYRISRYRIPVLKQMVRQTKK